jgi:N-carbamoylputrescine amidase
MMSTLRIAIVQVESRPGQISDNHAHAQAFIESAALQGAQIIVLPELFACGYIPNQGIWQYAEKLDGATVTWMRETSKRLGIYLGAGFAEIDGADFFNSFALTDPQGNLAGVARKTRAETYCFKYGAGRHIIPTEFGRIGVGICADNHYTSFFKMMQGSNIDLLLMPHASPMPYKTSKTISEADIERSRENALSIPSLYARLLGIPVVFSNAVGELEPMTGLLGKFLTPQTFRLRGLSRIVNSDGALQGELGESEDVLICDVTRRIAHRQDANPPDYEGWLHQGSRITRKVLIPFDVLFGRASYFLSPARRSMTNSIQDRKSQ